MAPSSSPTAPSSNPDARCSSLGRRLGALAGAGGALAAGAEAEAAIVYTPTAGVVAAQGIPGFSFVDATNVTLGNLRPPAAIGTIGWDVDGTGGDDFQLTKFSTYQARLTAVGGQWIYGTVSASFRGMLNKATGAPVSGNLAPNERFFTGPAIVTFSGDKQFFFFTANVSGQFGFRFTNASDTHYGWASLLIDETPIGQGYKITEAYYQSTPGTAINVGAVPASAPEPVPEPGTMAVGAGLFALAAGAHLRRRREKKTAASEALLNLVPEPAPMTLMALGAAGVAAWRSRRTAKAAAGAESAAKTET